MKPHPFLGLFFAIAAFALLGAPALAHKGEQHGEGAPAHVGPMGAPAKEAGLMWKKLGRPEYVHVLLNPLPIYGSLLGALALTAALVLRSKEARFVGLLVVLIATGSALPVLLSGQNAYDRLRPDLSEEAQQWLDLHMARAEFFAYLFYATALVAAGGLATWRRAPKAAAVLAKIALAGAVACSGLAIWIGHAGGEIMHSEWREGPPPGQEAEVPHDEENPDTEQPPAQDQPSEQPATLTKEQIEASRMQLDASRAQLEASRKMLEAADKAQVQPEGGKPTPSPAPAAQTPKAADGHQHKH